METALVAVQRTAQSRSRPLAIETGRKTVRSGLVPSETQRFNDFGPVAITRHAQPSNKTSPHDEINHRCSKGNRVTGRPG
jgi:hypothetical protein